MHLQDLILARVQSSASCFKSYLVLLVVSVLVGGCAGNNDERLKHESVVAVHGSIIVDILEAGSRPRYWLYAIRPGDGTVTRIQEQQFATRQSSVMPKTYAQPAGAISSCNTRPEAVSPNGALVAACEVPPSQTVSFVVFERATHRELQRWSPAEYRDIRGFAWAPDSKSVAVLNKNEYHGKSPLELLARLSGHPVPHNTVFIELFVADGWKRTEYPIRKDVINAFTRIIDWTFADQGRL